MTQRGFKQRDQDFETNTSRSKWGCWNGSPSTCQWCYMLFCIYLYIDLYIEIFISSEAGFTDRDVFFLSWCLSTSTWRPFLPSGSGRQDRVPLGSTVSHRVCPRAASTRLSFTSSQWLILSYKQVVNTTSLHSPHYKSWTLENTTFWKTVCRLSLASNVSPWVQNTKCKHTFVVFFCFLLNVSPQRGGTWWKISGTAGESGTTAVSFTKLHQVWGLFQVDLPSWFLSLTQKTK